jgi:hypothetical protein
MTIPDADASDELLLAMARVEASLRIVLAAIAELKAEMKQPNRTPDVPLRPDSSWVGTP